MASGKREDHSPPEKVEERPEKIINQGYLMFRREDFEKRL